MSKIKIYSASEIRKSKPIEDDPKKQIPSFYISEQDHSKIVKKLKDAYMSVVEEQFKDGVIGEDEKGSHLRYIEAISRGEK